MWNAEGCKNQGACYLLFHILAGIITSLYQYLVPEDSVFTSKLEYGDMAKEILRKSDNGDIIVRN